MFELITLPNTYYQTEKIYSLNTSEQLFAVTNAAGITTGLTTTSGLNNLNPSISLTSMTNAGLNGHQTNGVGQAPPPPPVSAQANQANGVLNSNSNTQTYIHHHIHPSNAQSTPSQQQSVNSTSAAILAAAAALASQSSSPSNCSNGMSCTNNQSFIQLNGSSVDSPSTSSPSNSVNTTNNLINSNSFFASTASSASSSLNPTPVPNAQNPSSNAFGVDFMSKNINASSNENVRNIFFLVNFQCTKV